MPFRSLFASFLLLAFLAFPFSVHAKEAEPSISAAASALYEPCSQTFLFQKNADKRRPMASTTKIMTALIAIEKMPLDSEIRIAADAAGIEGSSVYLRAGEVLSLHDLLYAILLASANDAASAVAIAIGGSISGFADLMNQKAASLGLKDTHFTNPHGLDDPEHYTTAHDLALIAAEAMQNSTFRKIAATKSYTIPATEDHSPRVLFNHNKLLALCDSAIGVKTGFTKKSGRCLVGAAERDGTTLIAVTLNAPSDWDDHKTLFDYGFSMMETVIDAEENALAYPVQVIGGGESHIICRNRDSISIRLPKGEPAPQCILKLRRYRIAPIEKGDLLGTVEYRYKGKIIAASPLIAEKAIPKTPTRKGHF